MNTNSALQLTTLNIEPLLMLTPIAKTLPRAEALILTRMGLIKFM